MDNAMMLDKFGGVSQFLNIGDIWETQKYGVIVVVATQPAEWNDEDQDIYGHVDTWFTIRPVTDSERSLWDMAVTASTARKQQRATLNARTSYEFNGNCLVPGDDATRRLDSYDDRWEPPTPITLTPEQIEVEEEYIRARAALKNH